MPRWSTARVRATATCTARLNLPTLLIGGLGGTIKGNRYIEYSDAAKTPFMNLHMALLDKAGVQVEKIGDADGMLTDI